MDDDFNRSLNLWPEEQKLRFSNEGSEQKEDSLFVDEEDLNLIDVFLNTNTTADTGSAAVTTPSGSSLLSSAGPSRHDSPSSGFASFSDKPAGSSSPQSSHIPALVYSSIIPATADYNAGYEKHEAANTRASSLKRTLENNESESKADQKTKMSGSLFETWRHRMSERKRRRELSQKFAAISAKIPDLEKDTDHTDFFLGYPSKDIFVKGWLCGSSSKDIDDMEDTCNKLYSELLNEGHDPSVYFNTNTTADTGGAAVTTTSASSLFSSASQSRHDSPSSGFASFCDKSAGSSSPQPSYNPPLDDSSIMNFEKHEAANTRAFSPKRTLEKNERESKADQKTKKSRSSSETLDHTTSERIRRQELSQKLVAIAAKIPDLKKFDKLSVLSETINYMEKLEGRVKELEEQKKIREDKELFLMSMINDHHHQDTISSCTSDDKCFRIINQGLPEIEARVLHNQILIRIHCEKPDSVMPTILAQLKSLHLSIISSSILNFANSTLDITILARVDEHKIEVKEVVKKLRSVLLETSQPIKLISAVQP